MHPVGQLLSRRSRLEVIAFIDFERISGSGAWKVCCDSFLVLVPRLSACNVMWAL